MTFQQILDKYRQIAFSERDKGDKFERLMQAYLQTDPTYSSVCKNVWLWNEFPFKDQFGGKDIGIDIVVYTNTKEYWAVQCKCYKEGAHIDKPAIDSFLSTSSKTFTDESGDKIGFSQRLWIETTGKKWGSNAEQAIQNQNPPVNRLNLIDLQNSPVIWEELEKGNTGEEARSAKKSPREHQKTALQNTNNHFKTKDRGKLVMACGTGKTYTSLCIAENETGGNGLILFLVPSIALLGQTLREWTADAQEPINPICICSDSRITKNKKKKDDEDGYSVVDLALPASTDVKKIVKQFSSIKENKQSGLTVVFSTYQSIDVIANAQAELLALDNSENPYGIFDLIICDEAHRTTGVTLAGRDESAFVKVHDSDFIQAKKRLYMTATPRLFSDDSKSKAAQKDAILCSMDDENLFGEEIYRIGFGEAVEKGLLTDYKVLILTLRDTDIPASIQSVIADDSSEINADDASKLIGCINGLSKQILGDAGLIKESDPDPMRRAVAFCQNIKISKKITSTFNETADIYMDALAPEKKEEMVSVSSKHIDGSMAAPEREELLNWLKENNPNDNNCRILTNVKCLSEGVDVPSLDAVLFLSARNSQVDVVQSVGRVMRRAEGKKYGYIIIPVVVPTNVEASKALDDNDRYKVVWSVLNALRAHDDRFNATINKIDLNKKKPPKINVGGPGGTTGGGSDEETSNEINKQLALQFEELQSVFYAKMVQKVGDRVYWEKWAKDVAIIAEKQIDRITNLIDRDGEHQKIFEEFLNGLKQNINPSISKQQAIEMLSQHIITKPVFEALFEGYSFAKSNAISISMQKMLDLLEDHAIEKDTETLDKFYDSVRKRAEGIDNAEGKQRIIIELYDKFFKTAFPKMVEQLGIVYTPVEVVDFIIHSVNDILKQEFGRTISDENIHILDPFTGTGTFITRLLQSGLIKLEDLDRKYNKELHANEIVLLAYYIATINIENAYHDATPDPDDGIGKEKYFPFEGICLTDTFQLRETQANERFFSEMFPKNTERVEKQRNAPIRVIIGNPPYSIGQKSANDNAQNQTYPKLDLRISETYANATNATNKNSLYDSYIKAFRWSSDRLGENGGIICFVSNGAWLDGNAQDGFRKHLEKEFSSIYVFNLRGNQRTSGELSRKEGGKIFGSGSRTPISITLLVKKTSDKKQKATIFYKDIGDYLNREEKLSIIKNFRSVSNKNLNWQVLKPNIEGDWINHRNKSFDKFISLEKSKKKEIGSVSFFSINSLGLTTGRDSWCVNFSIENLTESIKNMIAFYSEQLNSLVDKLKIETSIDLDNNPRKISWSRGLKRRLENKEVIKFESNSIFTFLYRPFCKSKVYYNRQLNEYIYKWENLLPTSNSENYYIFISSKGTTSGLSILIGKNIADAHFNGDTQCLPLYYYEEKKEVQTSWLDEKNEVDSKFIRYDGISDSIYIKAKKQYGISQKDGLSKEDIFYYVYGFLHSPDYRKTFANDLKKMLPRIPLVDSVKDFWAFSKAGRELADLHINYETVPAFDELIVTGAEKHSFIDDKTYDDKHFIVEKMRFPKKGQKDTIIYNSRITITDIPEKAYEYVVNGKSAIEWVMERYQVKTDKKSGIKNDPNDWAKEVENPRYILDLLLSIINVSVRTVDIVNSLPKLKFD